MVGQAAAGEAGSTAGDAAPSASTSSATTPAASATKVGSAPAEAEAAAPPVGHLAAEAAEPDQDGPEALQLMQKT